jgi:KDO2-lipid IV(A) lauroyltransferase
MHFKPITIASERLRPPQLFALFTQMRAERNVRLVPYEHAPREMLAALKRNEAIAFMLDFGVTHHFDLTTVPVTFFGTETDMPAGPAQFSLTTGAAIVVGHSHVAPNGHIDLYLNPPLFAQRTGNRRHDLQVTMQAVVKLMEDFIQRYPEQWNIFRPMWRDDSTAHRNIPSLSKPNSTKH